MEKEILSDKIKMATSQMSFFIDELAENDKLCELAQKNLVPLRRNLGQKIEKFIIRLDKAINRHSFSPEITNNVKKEIQNLFEMILPIHGFSEKLVEIYDSIHDDSYEDFIEKIEQDMIDSVNQSFEKDGIRTVNSDEIPLLQGTSLKEVRDFERALTKVVFERSIDPKSPQISDNLYVMVEEEQPKIFDQEYSLVAKDLLRALRAIADTNTQIDTIREELDAKLTFDNYTTDTSKIQLQIVRLLRVATKNLEKLSKEDTLEVISCIKAFQTTLDHENSTRKISLKYDNIDEFISLEGRNEDTGEYNTKIDLYNETIDLLKANIQGVEMGLKRIRTREDIIVFFSNHDEENN